MSGTSVFVVNRLVTNALPMLRERFPLVKFEGVADYSEFPNHPLDCDVLFSWKLEREWLDRMPRLRWVQVAGAGVDRVVFAEGLAQDVRITRMHGDFAEQMAEYALACVMHDSFDWPRWAAMQEKHIWKRPTRHLARHRVAGVMGLGVIGREVARTLHGAGLKVWGWSRSGTETPGCDRVFAEADWGPFLAGLDYVILVLPLTPGTRNFLDESRLSLFKPGAVLVNMARAEILNEGALRSSLDSGRLGRAYLDVFWNEPLEPGNAWWSHPRVVVTPHIAGVNRPEDLVNEFAHNLERYLRDEPLVDLVDRRRGY